MSYRLSPLTLRRTPARLAIYQKLLADPSATWTVADTAAELTANSSVETVRATLYVLAEDGILRARPHGQCLEFVLRSGGAARLRWILNQWTTGAPAVCA